MKIEISEAMVRERKINDLVSRKEWLDKVFVSGVNYDQVRAEAEVAVDEDGYEDTIRRLKWYCMSKHERLHELVRLRKKVFVAFEDLNDFLYETEGAEESIYDIENEVTEELRKMFVEAI